MKTRKRQQEKAKAIPPFHDWLKLISPQFQWDWPYQLYIQSHLDKVTAGSIRRLALFLPPRHGKSELATIRYPVWRIEREPGMRIIIGAYSQMLSDEFNRKARCIASERIKLSNERKAADDWQTKSGGGMRAVGVGAGMTGHGANLIIVDDPVKNREEANSEAYRRRVWDWYTNDLYTRLEPDGAIILIQTRWHEDDLAGRILASESGRDWTVISLAAEADNMDWTGKNEQPDPLGRKLGEALCPERFDLPVLAQIKTTLGRAYYALYQQKPQPLEGEMFKRAWFTIVDAVPAGANFIRYWDKAATEGGGCNSAGSLWAAHGGLFYFVDCIAGQWSAGEREAVIRQTAQLDQTRFGNVTIWIEQEPGSGGKESADASIRNLSGFIVYADKVTGDKVTRAEPLAAQGLAGNLRMVRGNWNVATIDEFCSFPSGKFKDRVDSSSGAFNKLAIPLQIWI